MSKDSLQTVIQGLEQSTIREIKMPSGDTVKIRAKKPIQSLTSQSQLAKLRKIPTFDLPPLEPTEHGRK